MATPATTAAAGPGGSLPPSVERLLGRIRPVHVLAVLIFIGMAAVMWKARHLDFYYDEYEWFERRMLNWSTTDEFLKPHNEHLVLFPALVFKALFSTVGLHPYWPYVLVATIVHATCVVLAFQLMRKRVGDWTAVVLVIPLIFLGRAAQNLGLWPFEMTLTGSVAGALGAFLALERGTRKGDVLASFLLVVAYGCSGIGLAAMPAVALRLIFSGTAAWRRLWVVVPPLVLYAIWYQHYGAAQVQFSVLQQAPHWMVDALAGASGALMNLQIDWGRPLAVVVAGAVLWRLCKPGPIPARLIGWITLAGTAWFLIASKRLALPPDTARYVHVGAFAVILMLSEVIEGITIPRRTLVVAAAFLSFGAMIGLNQISVAGNELRTTTNIVEPQLAALALAGDRVPPEIIPDSKASPLLIAGDWQRAVRHWGDSNAPAVSELPTAGSDQGRVGADEILLAANSVRVLPAARPKADAQGAEICTIAGAESGSRAIAGMPLPPEGLRVRAGSAPVAIQARRFGSRYGLNPVTPVPAHTVRLVKPIKDAAPGHWRLRLRSAQKFTVCQ